MVRQQFHCFLTEFYGEQYINQLYNVHEEPTILSYDQIRNHIMNLSKINFVMFIKKILIFSNMKLAYQGKREVKNLQSLVLKRI